MSTNIEVQHGERLHPDDFADIAEECRSVLKDKKSHDESDIRTAKNTVATLREILGKFGYQDVKKRDIGQFFKDLVSHGELSELIAESELEDSYIEDCKELLNIDLDNLPEFIDYTVDIKNLRNSFTKVVIDGHVYYGR